MILTRLRALALALVMLPAVALAQSQPVPTAIGIGGAPKDVTAAAIVTAPAGGGAGKGTVVAPDNPFPITCITGCAAGVAFTPAGPASLNVTSASGRVALPSGANLIMVNNGTTDLYYKLGNSTVTATTSDFLLPIGHAIVIAAGANTHIAAITSTSTSTLSLTGGAGSPVISGGGGSGGGGVAGVTASSTPTAVSAGANKPMNEGLFGNLFTTLVGADGAVIDLSSPVVFSTTDKGGTITSGGAAQNAIAANASRKQWCIQNDPAASEVLNVRVSGAASATSGTALQPGAQACSPQGYVDTAAVSVFAATTGHRWFGQEFQ